MIKAIHLKDGYKAGHVLQYPEGTELVYSNWTARSSKLKGVDKVVFFGLQYFIKRYLIQEFNESFFNINKLQAVSVYKRRMDLYLGKGAVPTEHIEDLHDLGYLPIRILALPEGSQVPLNVPMLTIENTLDEFFWVTNMLETIMSTSMWVCCTSATIALRNKELLLSWAYKTGVDKDFVQFQAHDFSMRGMAGLEAAMMSGAGHLTSFYGTDTIPAIDFLEHYYQADADKEMIGVSVPATEHSVMCMGEKESEIDTFERLITEIYPSGIVSIVSDTWDLWKVVGEFLPKLKDKILARDGRVVIRPDSGDPVKIITGYTKDDIFYDGGGPFCKKTGEWLSVEEIKGLVECLYDIFGGTRTDEGYLEIDSHIGAIYGDAITYEREYEILSRLANKGFASSNIVFGVGSYTYQYNTRDTFGFAMKATAGKVNGKFREIFKDPKTDNGEKKSAKGFIRVDRIGGEYVMRDQVSYEDRLNGEMKTVFVNGGIVKETSLGEIRNKINE